MKIINHRMTTLAIHRPKQFSPKPFVYICSLTCLLLSCLVPFSLEAKGTPEGGAKGAGGAFDIIFNINDVIDQVIQQEDENLQDRIDEQSLIVNEIQDLASKLSSIIDCFEEFGDAEEAAFFCLSDDFFEEGVTLGEIKGELQKIQQSRLPNAIKELEQLQKEQCENGCIE